MGCTPLVESRDKSNLDLRDARIVMGEGLTKTNSLAENFPDVAATYGIPAKNGDLVAFRHHFSIKQDESGGLCEDGHEWQQGPAIL